MMGGELAEDVGLESGVLELNEEAHAAADEDEAIAGRLRNRNRLDLLRAIRAMSRAATTLNDAEPSRALPDEREALTMLQRAFSRTRYILRTLTERERIDLARRLTGSLGAVTRDARPVDVLPANNLVLAERQALADIASIAGAVELSGDAGSRVTALAQSLLGLNPAARDLQAVATLLTDAAGAIRRADAGAARVLLDSASVQLVVSLRASLRDAAIEPRPVGERALAGALADVLTGRGGSR
jgi:hypothetical protein